MSSSRWVIVACVAVVAVGSHAEPAEAKMPQLRFEARRAAAGSTVSAVVRPWPQGSLGQLRFFLVHGHDLAAMFHPTEWMAFGTHARKTAKDVRFVAVRAVPVPGRETSDGWVTAQIRIPATLPRGQYTTAVLACEGTCVLELALQPRRLSILRSIGRWDQRLALRID